jgi:hypothetical protein
MCVVKMRKLIFFVLPLALLLSSCRMQLGNGANGGNGLPSITAPTETPVVIASSVPTQTSVPTATVTPVPTPDLSVVGLPAEAAGTTALDFVDTMCKAQWFTEIQNLPCPGNDKLADTGYVMQLDGNVQNLPPSFNLLLTFPPQKNVNTIFSKYPDFTVKKGDRFRAVLTCRPHAFCDVEFGLNYYDGQGSNGLKHWPYLFTDSPIAVDYSLDGLAGKTVQFNLAVQSIGNGVDAYAVWIAPHIYRPAP